MARKIFAQNEARDEATRKLGVPVQDVLMEPTRIYAKGVNSIRGDGGVSGIAHITGGGIPGNVDRVMPDGLQAKFYPETWTAPAIFPLIQEFGPVESEEMYRTFNMGLGLVFLAGAERVDDLLESLKNAGETAMVVGEVAGRPRGGRSVVVEGVL